MYAFGYILIFLIHLDMQSVSVFLDNQQTTFADSRWKNADVSRTQGVCHVICIFFGSSLGKV